MVVEGHSRAAALQKAFNTMQLCFTALNTQLECMIAVLSDKMLLDVAAH